jgi:hypothetical protein
MSRIVVLVGVLLVMLLVPLWLGKKSQGKLKERPAAVQTLRAASAAASSPP